MHEIRVKSLTSICMWTASLQRGAHYCLYSLVPAWCSPVLLPFRASARVEFGNMAFRCPLDAYRRRIACIHYVKGNLPACLPALSGRGAPLTFLAPLLTCSGVCAQLPTVPPSLADGDSRVEGGCRRLLLQWHVSVRYLMQSVAHVAMPAPSSCARHVSCPRSQQYPSYTCCHLTPHSFEGLPGSSLSGGLPPACQGRPIHAGSSWPGHPKRAVRWPVGHRARLHVR